MDSSADIYLQRRQRLQQLGAAAAALTLPLGVLAQTAPLRIGYVSPQTGALAAFGETDNFTLQIVRDALQGGIRVGGKNYPVQIIVKDSQSNPNRAAEVADELINQHQVQLMLCAATPDTTNPVGDQCELAEVPCISTAAPWEAWYFGRGGTPGKGFDWTYHFFFGLADGITAYTNLWKKLPTNKTVGLLFSNDADGEAWSDKVHGLPAALLKQGYQVINPGKFQSNSDNFTPHISAFKKAGVEIVSGVMNPPDLTTFWNQARQQGFKPKIATIAKALVFPVAVENLGTAGDGLTSEVLWSRYHPFRSTLTGQSAAQYADLWETRSKKQWTPALGWLHALFEVGLDALSRSSNPFDKKAVRQAIRSANLKTLLGPVNFATGPVPNVSAVPLVAGQWRPGKKYKYELDIVSNEAEPVVPVTAKLRPIS